MTVYAEKTPQQQIPYSPAISLKTDKEQE